MSIDNENVVWANTMDGGAWLCSVVRHEATGYGGWLMVASAEGEVVHRQYVGIAYGAIWGPDIDDVDTWMGRCVEVIDNPERRSIQ